MLHFLTIFRRYKIVDKFIGVHELYSGCNCLPPGTKHSNKEEHLEREDSNIVPSLWGLRLVTSRSTCSVQPTEEHGCNFTDQRRHASVRIPQLRKLKECFLRTSLRAHYRTCWYCVQCVECGIKWRGILYAFLLFVRGVGRNCVYLMGMLLTTWPILPAPDDIWIWSIL
jgi:hypothetical protein